MNDIKLYYLRFLALLFFSILFYNSKSQNPFIENKGQLPANVNSKVVLPGGALFIEQDKFTYAFYNQEQLEQIHDGQLEERKVNAHAYSVTFLNTNKNNQIRFLDESQFHENYFIGDPKTWATEVKSYKKYSQEDIYSGIDLIMFTERDSLKFELHVEPNHNPNRIKLKYEGLKSLKIIDREAVSETSINKVIEKRPFAYQIINNNKIEVPCYYSLNKEVITFDFPEGYNTRYKLIIDPTLEFSTYSGSTADNFGYTATYDDFGFLYSGGTVFQVGYPTTLGAYDITYNNLLGGTDIGITKYNTTGTQRIYSTYLGGASDELPHSMIVNSANELFLFGTTGSQDFPTTNFGYQTVFKGGDTLYTNLGVTFYQGTDMFVSRLSSDGGVLLASTFIGGSGNDGLNIAPRLKFNYADEVRGEIDIDRNNNIYIATSTQSTDFPIINGFQNTLTGNQEGCIVKMDNQLTSIIWSSYLGGERDDAIYSLALDDIDNIYVTGGTNSVNFPTTANSYLTNYQDSIRADAFISKISYNGTQILYSSYYGTAEYDQSYFVELGSNNRVYLFGQTKAGGITLVNNATYYEPGGGQFIAVFSKDLTLLLQSTVVGTGKGTPDISPTAFLVDVCEKIYLAGWGSNLGGPLSTLNLPITTDAFQSTTDGNDFYLMVIDDLMTNLLYGTYFGGGQSNEHVDGGTSRFDKKGIIYQSVCAGCGGSSDFPIEPNPGAVSSTNNSINCNNGVFKFNFDFPMVIADFSAPWVGCQQTIDFQNLSLTSSIADYQWDFGDGSNSFLINPSHTFLNPGEHSVTLIVSDPGSCNASDTIVKNIYILSNSLDTIEEINTCINEQVQIGLLPVNDPTITYLWTPDSTLSSPIISNPISTTNTSTDYQLLISSEGCTDTLIQTVTVFDFQLETSSDTTFCSSPIELTAFYDLLLEPSIIWSNNIDFNDTLSETPTLIIDNIGVFYVQVTNGNCLQIDSVQVSSQSLDFSLFSNEICQGDTALVGVLNENPIVPIISYEWLNFTSDSAIITDIPDSSRWYTVEILNMEGCTLRDSIFVNVNPYPIIDSLWSDKHTVFEGEGVTVYVDTEGIINWLNFNTNKPLLNDYPENDYCYTVQVYNEYSCSIFDSICVSVIDVFCSEDSILIPTAFSPDNDFNLLNETYFIKDNAGVIVSFKLEIFNRLGQKVFSTFDINDKWRGTYKGKKLPPQVLDFYLEIQCVGGKSLFKKGNITLIR